MGTALQLVDDKQRVSIPAKFRDAVIANTDPDDLKAGASVMIGQHPESNCLIGFDRSWIEAEMAKAAADLANGSSRFNTLRGIAGGAEPVGFDSTGRCVLVKWMKDEVGIGGRAFFYGSITHFEIWDPATLLSAGDEVLPVVKNACRRIMAEKGLA